LSRENQLLEAQEILNLEADAHFAFPRLLGWSENREGCSRMILTNLHCRKGRGKFCQFKLRSSVRIAQAEAGMDGAVLSLNLPMIWIVAPLVNVKSLNPAWIVSAHAAYHRGELQVHFLEAFWVLQWNDAFPFSGFDRHLSGVSSSTFHETGASMQSCFAQYEGSVIFL